VCLTVLMTVMILPRNLRPTTLRRRSYLINDQLIREFEYLLVHFSADYINIFPISDQKIIVTLGWWRPSFRKSVGFYEYDTLMDTWYLHPAI
jgi:hypothetical protein